MLKITRFIVIQNRALKNLLFSLIKIRYKYIFLLTLKKMNISEEYYLYFLTLDHSALFAMQKLYRKITFSNIITIDIQAINSIQKGVSVLAIFYNDITISYLFFISISVMEVGVWNIIVNLRNDKAISAFAEGSCIKQDINNYTRVALYPNYYV